MRSSRRAGKAGGVMALVACLLGVPGMPAWGQGPEKQGAKTAAPVNETRPLDFAQKGFADAMVGVPFHSSVLAVGGSGLFTFTMSGDLPPGLYLESGSNTVAVSGIPTEAGEFSIDITIRDIYGAGLTRTFPIHVDSKKPGLQLLPAFVTDAEGFKFSDSDEVFFPVVIVVNEAIHVTDQQKDLDAILLVVNEGITVTDTIGAEESVMLPVNELITVTDTISTSVAWKPILAVAKSHTGNFTAGSTAVWNVQVTNTSGSLRTETSGTTTVVDTLPTGYTMAAFNGLDWTCSGSNTVTCTSPEAIEGSGGAFPLLQLTVNVPDPSLASVTNNVVAYGGGDPLHTNASNGATASDTAAVNPGEFQVTISTPALSFGSVNVGSSSNSQSLTLTNTGTATLTIGSIAVTGADASSFVFANNCGTSLAVGANCTIHGHFAPTMGGALSADITIATNAYVFPQNVVLSGTGIAPALSLSATSLSYAPTIVGESSGSQVVTVTNSTSAAVPIGSIAVTGTNASSFVFANSCGTSLAAGANCTVHGHFAPVSTGALKAAVTITYTGTGSPQSIALSGTGLKPPVTLSAASLSFGSVDEGATSASQTVVVTNSGTAAVTFTSIAVTGTNASSFVFANSCGTSLAVGATCTIHGHFAPTVTGALTAAIKITDSAITSPQSIALSGTGVALLVSLSGKSLSYPATAVGSSSGSQSVTMTNTGTAAVSIASIALTGTDASSFVFANNCGTTLAVGASCTIHGHFAPVATGALTASITITDSATGSPQAITLTGTGK